MNLRDLDSKLETHNMCNLPEVTFEEVVDATMTLEEAFATFDKIDALEERLQRAAVSLDGQFEHLTTEDAEVAINSTAAHLIYVAEEIGYDDMELSFEADSTKEEKKKGLGDKAKAMGKTAKDGAVKAAKWLAEQLKAIYKALKEWVMKAGSVIVKAFGNLKGKYFTRSHAKKAASIAPILFLKGNPTLNDLTAFLTQRLKGSDVLKNGYKTDVKGEGKQINRLGSTINFLDSEKKSISKVSIKPKDGLELELPVLGDSFIKKATEAIKDLRKDLEDFNSFTAKEGKDNAAKEGDVKIALKAISIISKDYKGTLRLLGVLAGATSEAKAKAADAKDKE